MSEQIHEDVYTKPLDEVYVHVHEVERKLSVWWVDDCFTNEKAAESGGYLPIEDVEAGCINPLGGNNSAQICYWLRKLSEEEGVNFKVCSFEYADKHWFDIIDNPKNAVLIDIGYEGKESEDVYGIKFYYEKAESKKPDAVCSLLTLKTDRLLTWLSRQDRWLPNLPYAIDKTGDNLTEQLRSLITYLKDQQPKGASEWSLDTWIAIREEARKVCEERKGEHSERVDWPHHMPFGGRTPRIQSKETPNLRERLSAIEPSVQALPQHSWESKDVKLPLWDQPPIRALAQIDEPGKDLTTLFRLLRGEVNTLPSLSYIELAISFTPPTLEHDYLWFNGSALARGLFILAESFSDYVKDVRAAKKSHTDFPKPYYEVCEGHLIWNLFEAPNSQPGFAVRIDQILVASNHKKPETACTIRKIYSIPNYSEADGQVREAYRYFQQAGAAEFKIVQDGALLVRIPAHSDYVEEIGNGIWRLERK